MATMQSFDVTTGCDLQEVDNAVQQTLKEVTQRYDFKGLKVEIELQRNEKKIRLAAPDEYKMKAVYDVLQTRMMRRKVPLKNLKPGNMEPAGGNTIRLEIELQQGIPTDTARAIVKFLKDQKVKKVQGSIQGDQVRVTSPSRDSLQAAMGLLKEKDFGLELQFGNYRG